MGRIVVAVAAGYAAIGVLVVITDQVFAAFIPGFKQMNLPPLYYFSASLVTDSFYSAMGGFLCALIARAQSRKATLALIVFGEIVGIVSQIAFWHIVPHWFGIALVVLYPPAVWTGSRLRSGMARPA